MWVLLQIIREANTTKMSEKLLCNLHKKNFSTLGKREFFSISLFDNHICGIFLLFSYSKSHKRTFQKSFLCHVWPLLTIGCFTTSSLATGRQPDSHDRRRRSDVFVASSSVNDPDRRRTPPHDAPRPGGETIRWRPSRGAPAAAASPRHRWSHFRGCMAEVPRCRPASRGADQSERSTTHNNSCRRHHLYCSRWKIFRQQNSAETSLEGLKDSQLSPV